MWLITSRTAPHAALALTEDQARTAWRCRGGAAAGFRRDRGPRRCAGVSAGRAPFAGAGGGRHGFAKAVRSARREPSVALANRPLRILGEGQRMTTSSIWGGTRHAPSERRRGGGCDGSASPRRRCPERRRAPVSKLIEDAPDGVHVAAARRWSARPFALLGRTCTRAWPGPALPPAVVLRVGRCPNRRTRPKSKRRVPSSPQTKMFSGLRSQWTNPWRCAASIGREDLQ